jgi:MoaA/NifB/PqqE/SkfB family radical SAM enzyme
MVPYKRIYLGSSCNNNCIYCSEKKKDSNQTIPDVTGSLVQNDSLDSIELYGGEPATRSDFFILLDTARNRGYRRIKLVTNARTCADINTAVRMIESGCHIYEIKIHHFRPDIHDYITQVRGSLQETVQGLANLRRINTLRNTAFSAFISLRISLSRKNIQDIASIVLAFIPYRIDRFILSFDDSELELSKALPHIQNAINLTLLNRTWITTQKIPPCYMQGFEHHIAELYHSHHCDYRKLETCMECPLDHLCPGIDNDFAHTGGLHDLKPFQGNEQMTEDIRNLTHEEN